MSKIFLAGLLAAGAAGALIAPVAAQGAALGPSAALCNSNTTAVQVDVRGFKARTGTVRVQIYSANSNYLEKRKWIERVDVPVSRAGTMSVCVPVKQQGNYVISVRHDINGNGKTDVSTDGGGMSNNPSINVFNLGKPAVGKVSFPVGSGLKSITIAMKYM